MGWFQATPGSERHGTGAAGVNIEDSTRIETKPLEDVDDQARKMEAAKKASVSADVPVLVNARTDAFRFYHGSGKNRLEETTRRGRTYRTAGADCIFAFGVKDAESISELVKSLTCPRQHHGGAETPPIEDLERLGVARVTFGSGPYCAALGLLKRFASELMTKGTCTILTDIAIKNAEMNRLVSTRS